MNQSLQICLWTLLELFALFSYAISDMPIYFDDPPVVHTYNRLPEIEKECSPFLSSASELKPDDVRGYKIRKELSFFQGDWTQELGRSPLVPFDDSDLPGDSLSVSSPLRLVGFEVKDVNRVHQLKNAVSLHGTMCIGMARNSTLLYDPRSNFYMAPGMSVLKIDFEGVYIETKKDGGQRLLCMLGNTTLPFWTSAPGTSSFTVSLSNNRPRLLQDGRLLLVLHYPNILSLTKRAILGELRSLNEPKNPRYFDVIHISSQLNAFSKYKFSSEKLKSRTCDLRLFRQDLDDDGANRFNNTEFCIVMRSFSGYLFNIVPNWRFFNTGRLGPFFLGRGTHKNVRLIMQKFICETMSNSARIAALFRAFPAEMEGDIAGIRTGISDMTMAVEGIWDASKGHLCLVGCPGVSSSGLQGCDSQISLYFPHSFSIKQRSIIFGSISSISSEDNSYDPILFELEMRPSDLRLVHGWYGSYFLLYNYSKIELAEAFWKRSQSVGLVNLIKPFFLSYPAKIIQLPRLVADVKRLVLSYSSLWKAKDVFAHYEINSLSYDLRISCYGTPVSSYNSHKPDVFIELEVLALGPLAMGRRNPWLHKDTAFSDNAVKVSKSEVLNVSLSLMFTQEPLKFTEKDYKNVSKLFLEGVYDPLAGEMYLIGCRRVTVQTSTLNLERGFDCLIEVKIRYPDEALRWLVNPEAEITITSLRNEDDSLYFHPIELQTSMLPYNEHQEDAVFRKVFEEILRNLMITASIALISSQLLYMKKNVDGIPYISVIMLSLQFLGYAYPVLSNSKFLLQEKECQFQYGLLGYDQLLTLLDYTAKLLVLTALVMTATLMRKVTEFRKQPHPDSPSKPIGVPQDKRVRQIIAVILVPGLLSYFLLYRSIFENEDVISRIGDTQLEKIWTYKTQEFMGFIQDLFLLPQIVENVISHSPFRPLGKLYYIGFTLMRVVTHLYDSVRDPVIDPYSDAAAFVNLDLLFTSRAHNITFVVIMTGLAIVLYIQQERSHQKFIQRQETVTAKSM
ncbi:uncharacterized protein LOC113782175 [Coffea eugenioides]|uniref:RING-type E3 ubiquitin transferase n=1 Tax=Coffea arabica TaxID=13443 RepID=A0A6P6U7F9_COFAR|nr:uncharacterized protein LOC113782175 [Coffea eugenioides]